MGYDVDDGEEGVGGFLVFGVVVGVVVSDVGGEGDFDGEGGVEVFEGVVGEWVWVGGDVVVEEGV